MFEFWVKLKQGNVMIVDLWNFPILILKSSIFKMFLLHIKTQSRQFQNRLYDRLVQAKDLTNE